MLLFFRDFDGIFRRRMNLIIIQNIISFSRRHAKLLYRYTLGTQSLEACRGT